MSAGNVPSRSCSRRSHSVKLTLLYCCTKLQPEFLCFYKKNTNVWTELKLNKCAPDFYWEKGRRMSFFAGLTGTAHLERGMSLNVSLTDCLSVQPWAFNQHSFQSPAVTTMGTKEIDMHGPSSFNLGGDFSSSQYKRDNRQPFYVVSWMLWMSVSWSLTPVAQSAPAEMCSSIPANWTNFPLMKIIWTVRSQSLMLIPSLRFITDHG